MSGLKMEQSEQSSSDAEEMGVKRKRAASKQTRKKGATNPDRKRDASEPVRKKAKTVSPYFKAKPAESDYSSSWELHEVVSEKLGLTSQVSEALVSLFHEDNSVPFIARYRSHMTGNMIPEDIQRAKNAYNSACTLQKKICSTIKSLIKTENLTEETRKTLRKCKTMDELESISAAFKQCKRKSLAQRALDLGLENASNEILMNPAAHVHLENLLASEKGLNTVAEIRAGIIHIIAHTFATNSSVLDCIRQLQNRSEFYLEAQKSAAVKKQREKSEKKSDNFQNYFNFSQKLKFVQAHQVLAINRGENLKVLSVKITTNDRTFEEFKNFCDRQFIGMNSSSFRRDLISEAIADAYKRLIYPVICRNLRSKLKKSAELQSIQTFTTNLKSLLMATPVKGVPIMAIDPGFDGGSKVATISSQGDFLNGTVIYPHREGNKAAKEIKRLLDESDCSIIGIGNGTGGRFVESWISDLIKQQYFAPRNISYTFVSECGASVYSCSKEARKELPNMNACIISAVSLARRLQDPLSELVKIDPQHLGIGMYQHDINKKQLLAALEEVVEECVSFVGVDVNTASACLLQRVAGLTAKKAEAIIERRTKQGPFTNRYQIKGIKGIGCKIFEQCAGFVRILPETAGNAEGFYDRVEATPLDCTWIHPESYDIARKLMAMEDLKEKDMGKSFFMQRFIELKEKSNLAEMAVEMKTVEATLRQVLDVLCKPLDHDIRTEFDLKPIFKTEVASMDDLTMGTILTGRVSNVTSFGAFVDIGLKHSGLIHQSQYNGLQLRFDEHVEVEIVNLDLKRNRIGLKALRKL